MVHKEDYIDYNKFYTKKEFEQVLASKGVKQSELKFHSFKESMQEYNRKLADSVFVKVSYHKILILKEFVDSIDWKFFKLLKSTKLKGIYKILIENHFEGCVSAYNTAIVLECDYHSIDRIIKEDNDIFTLVKNDGIKMIMCKDVIKWLEFKKSFITLGEIYMNVVDTIEEEKRGSQMFYLSNKRKMIEDGQFDKYNPIKQSDTPFRTKNQNELFIHIKYKNDIYEQIKHQLSHKMLRAFGSKKDKFNYRLNQIDTKNKKITLNEFSKFAISRLSELDCPSPNTYIYILDLIEHLGKELMLFKTEEIIKMINNLPSKKSKTEFIKFLDKLKSERTTKYSIIEYNEEHNKKKVNYNKPYTEEQYQRFGFLVLSNSHIWYEEYIEKALLKRAYASTWLYATLHYVSAWRAGDLLENLPRPNLRMDANTFLDKVKSKTLTKEEALDIVEQVNMRLNLWNLRPSKTASNTAPNLVMQIPESLFEFVGTLIGITEAHYQLSYHPGKKGLISKEAIDRRIQVEFYGQEFVEIFGESGFNNLRAVKNYEIIMSRKADKKELGTGYMLASIARAHKFKIDKKAETTMIYLNYYKNMEDSEIIVKELFERGVCSFVPYLLTKIVAGEENVMSLPHKKITKKIKETIDMDAFESEMVMQGYNLALENAKTKINEIIQDAVCNGLEPEEIAKNILLNIIYNEASSKQGELPCMLMAQGKQCVYPKRENCVGCGHEIYLKSCLFELGNRIQQAKQQALISKTQASKNKNILMIKNVLSPIVAEVFITLKDVYKIENIDIFKNLIR